MTNPTRTDWRTVWTIALGVLAGTVAAVGTVAVAVAGFTLSYDAIRTVGISAHIRPGWAWLLPVSVDGAMAVATVAAVVVRQVAGRTAYYPWLVVLTGAVISIACNGLHATGQLLNNDYVRFAVSAIPALMLTLSVHLLVTLIELSRRGATAAPDVAPEGVATVATPAALSQVTPAADVAPDVASPDMSRPLPDVAGSVIAPAADASLFRPYVLDRHVGDEDMSLSHVPTSLSPSDVASGVVLDVAPKADRGDTPMSRKTDSSDQKTARRRVARGDSCAAVARDIGVSPKTVERWTADIRAKRAAATSDGDAKPVNGARPDIDLAGVSP